MSPTTNNPYLLARLEGIRSSLLANHQGGHGLPNAVIGSDREIFIRRFLQETFPSHRRFTTGAITDSLGNLSGQVDIAVEYGFIPSFPMPQTDSRLLLAEGVALTIEVKSNLSSQWGEVEATTKKLKVLKRELGAVMTIGKGPPAHIPTIAIGYTGYASEDSLGQRFASTPADSRPDAALVIDSGAYVGFGWQASGPLGLYSLCVAINSLLTQVQAAHPNLFAYCAHELSTDSPTDGSTS